MSISVTCPECDATFRLVNGTAGKAIKCKKCGARVPVPAESDGDEPTGGRATGVRQTGDDHGSKPQGKKKSGTGKILIIVGGVVLLGCCLCTSGGVALPFLFPSLRFWSLASVAKDAKEMVVKDIKKDKDDGKGPMGKVLLEQKGVLTNNDPQEAGKPYKSFEVNFEQGKVYVIEMNSALDGHYLRLYDPTNKRVAEDGQFPTARITSMARQSGKHQIRVTTFKAIIPPEGLAFSLTVRER
jgi:predicted Zn finger-like uncharacterized protein